MAAACVDAGVGMSSSAVTGGSATGAARSGVQPASAVTSAPASNHDVRRSLMSFLPVGNGIGWANVAGAATGPACCRAARCRRAVRSEEHTSELQSLMRSSYAVFCLKTKNEDRHNNHMILQVYTVH